VLLLLPAAAAAQTLHVQPYLQLATPTTIHVMWESDSTEAPTVQYGPTEALGSEVAAVSFDGQFGYVHHRGELTGLTPGTRYFYRVTTGSTSSGVYDFVTPPDPSAETAVRIVAMSDMQQDWQHPTVFEEVVNDGVIAFLAAEFSADLPGELNAVLIPGDLVDNGLLYDQWADTFFTPAQNLLRHVPLYPVLGNHESDSAFFFQYFHLPNNEHWWTHDIGGVRVIGLDSNVAYRTQEQLDFLEGALDAACLDGQVDFVFAQLHHPYKSELWLAGETDWTGDVIELLEGFSTECGKPSVHFFGHTHGYSRGQSRDHRHLMVNVATSGGNIDYWGEYAQADYDEYVVSQDEYGFVLVEVEAGADPSFRLRRISRGNEDLTRDNEVRDDLTIRTNNRPPETPSALAPTDGETVEGGTVVLVASAWSDPDGDAQGAAQWQIATTCDDWAQPLADLWKQHRNEYGGTDLQAGDDLTDHAVDGLMPGVELCWRVRYRDQGLTWSAWSAGAAFRTDGEALSDNLLLNPGAEDGLEHWTITAGTLESLIAGECAGVEPHSGERYFVVGGLCDNESEVAAAVQRVELKGPYDAIDEGRATAWISGWFRDYSGTDLPEIEVIAYDGKGAKLLTSGRMGEPVATWTLLNDRLELPPGTRALEFVLHGTRFGGTDNDSYLDDLELRLSVESAEGDDDDAADDDDAVDDDDGGSGCGCTNSGQRPASVSGLGLLLLLLRRRPGGRRTATR
jgi:hypothetical protein